MQPSVVAGFSRLSQELIDEIIDYYFIRGDQAKLMEHKMATKACPLISRAFHDRSQKLLFTTLSLYMDDESQMALEDLKRLNDVFSTNPRLASRVRTLELQVRFGTDLWNPCFEDRNFMECMAHISQSGVGHQPPHLELYLSPKRRLYLGPVCNRMPRSHAFETRFVPFIASRLTRMEIGYLLDVPIALFDTSHNPVKLSIDRITLAPFEESKRVPIENRPLIRELWVKESEDVVQNNCLRFDKLSKVTFCNYNIMTVQRILSNPPPSSLEYLQFDAEDGDAYLEAFGSKYAEIGVELSTLPNLREISIYVTFPGDVDESYTDMDVVTSVAHFLPTCPAGHQLKHVGLTFEILFYLTNMDGASEAMEGVLNYGNWAALNSVLLSMTNSIAHVLEVEIHISFWLSLEFNTPFLFDPVAIKEIIAENKEYLCAWGKKYLPWISASDSPNLDLKISTQHDIVYPIDGYDFQF